ncbi:hypothetical protein Kpol_479p18 [Vanderwaltozyma polyspora DSM 70294]|uniref:Uncharacterized protein n=1 Tax=Vanderwaltozyma polyspora (strain ATCC 22028 / DSM 70294 / BCRC 21397 / CBS 2163 / NBRC 10782 / NRRL Y-8283 / UCD 57-17) TaxID=436907 RepID=A7TQD1_VANPO|nr:uncharacterized protein Kpol_479p18 [Vanderwaltozyma polyspora DSM 70294]EDO15530.1 hypothetical protein Kpol_479p18 [Vanderwaltozyma polyspora DSM 70294]
MSNTAVVVQQRDSPSSDSSSSQKNPSSWDPQDDILLRHLKEVKKMGWKDISKYFNNRTPNACQFRWRRLKSGNLKSNKTATININEYNIELAIPDNVNVCIPQQQQQQSPAPQQQHQAVKTNSVQQVPIQVQVPSIPQHPPTFSPVFTHSNPYDSSSTTANTGTGTGSSSNSGSFIKPRSMSHSLSKPNQSFNTPLVNPAGPRSQSVNVLPPDQENIGFVPKIIVRSRRSSFAHTSTAAQQQNPLNLSAPFPIINHHHLSTKSRKNSFSTRSRRSSFNFSSSTPLSRRHSVVSSTPNIATPTQQNLRRNSIVQNSRSSSTSMGTTYMDLPPHLRRGTTQQPQLVPQSHQQPQQVQQAPSKISWTPDEDKILLESGRKMSSLELSLLLPNKPDIEIRSRLATLLSETSAVSTNSQNTPSPSASQSPLNSPRNTYISHSVKTIESAIDEDTFDEDDEEAIVDDDEINISKSNHRFIKNEHNMGHLRRDSSASPPTSKDISPNAYYSNNSTDSSKNSPSSLNVRSASVMSSATSSTTTTTAGTANTSNSTNMLNNKQLPSISTLLQDMI